MAGAAAACEIPPALADGRRVESAGYLVVYRTAPAPIAVGGRFDVELAVCPAAGKAPVRGATVDATMPEHRHGMNYRPEMTTLGPGRYRAAGLLFHMPGLWRVEFKLATASGTVVVGESLTVD
ncbi:MAG: FixH family protein [Rhodospirillales bacterium]|nr:MAG: FixH family protein [Rhodospirillales bacterium]